MFHYLDLFQKQENIALSDKGSKYDSKYMSLLLQKLSYIYPMVSTLNSLHFSSERTKEQHGILLQKIRYLLLVESCEEVLQSNIEKLLWIYE